MSKNVVHIFLINVVIFQALYSVHNFIGSILKNSGVITIEIQARLQLLEIFKFLNIFLLSYFVDKNNRYLKYLLGISVLIHGLFALFLVYVRNIHDKDLRLICIILTKLVMDSFNGIPFPLIDSLSIQIMNDKSKNINYMKLGGTIGHMSVMGLLRILEGLSDEDNWTKIHGWTGLTCSIIAFILTVTLHVPEQVKSFDEMIETKDETKDAAVQNHTRSTSRLRGFLSLPFILYTLSVLFVGLDKTVISQFLTQFSKEIGLKNKEVLNVYLVRCLPELFIYLFISNIRINMYVIYLISISFTIIRTFLYVYLPVDKMTKQQIQLTLACIEIFKGIYGSLFSYSAVRIFHEHSSRKTSNDKMMITGDQVSNRALAQGIYHSVYGPIPTILFACAGFFFKQGQQADIEIIRKMFLIVGIAAIIALVA
ncbi:Major Facilitator Superfamily (MFS), partial [Pseudoloma neurophilia]